MAEKTGADEDLIRRAKSTTRSLAARRLLTLRFAQQLREEGVLRPGGVGGRGKATRYTPDAPHIAASLAEVATKYKPWHRRILVAWWRGTAIAQEVLLRALDRQVIDVRRRLVKIAQGARQHPDDAGPLTGEDARLLAAMIENGWQPRPGAIHRILAPMLHRGEAIYRELVDSSSQRSSAAPPALPGAERLGSLLVQESALSAGLRRVRTMPRAELDACRDNVRNEPSPLGRQIIGKDDLETVMKLLGFLGGLETAGWNPRAAPKT